MMELINKEFTMELINKLEKLVLGWAKNVPHLPPAARKWLGTNVWWIVLIGAILSAIAVLSTISLLSTSIALIGTVSSAYYVSTTYTSLVVVNAAVSLAFLAITALLLGLAVRPLKDKQKKGWVLLFFALLVEALYVVIGAVLSFSVGGFIVGILFGGIGIAIGAYFITEIHGQFGPAAKITKTSTKKAE